VSWLRLIAVGAVLLSAASCFAAEPNVQNEQEKAAISRETAQDWLQVGLQQSKKGLYEQAEKSFLAAKEYQAYLTAQERTQLEKHIAEARQAVIERQPVLEHIKKARELRSQGQPVEARAHYEKVRNSPYLTQQERKQIDQEIEDADGSFDRQKQQFTEIYNRSVQLYRAGEIEKAREGFLEVSRYGLLVLPQGQTAEDYLIQIDSVLASPFKAIPDSNLQQPAEEEPKAENVMTQSLPAAAEVPLFKPATDETVVEKQSDQQSQMKQLQEDKAEVTEEARPQPEAVSTGEQAERKTDAVGDKEARVKIAKSYAKAVVEDAAVKTDYYISTGEFDKAIMKVRAATEAVKKNRSLIGDELFTQYSVRLKQLADNIIHAQKSS
jgi:hypothetical protein